MPERIIQYDPKLPPPGQRSGHGSESVLPYLTRTLAAKPLARPEIAPERLQREEKPSAD
jgi:hypothetical protein